MIGALIEALRPKQWTKNLLLFAGILFSQQLDQPPLLIRAAAGFFAFCLLSGSVYLLNDLADTAADRHHPRKRSRPIASGRLPIPIAPGVEAHSIVAVTGDGPIARGDDGAVARAVLSSLAPARLG